MKGVEAIKNDDLNKRSVQSGGQRGKLCTHSQWIYELIKKMWPKMSKRQ